MTPRALASALLAAPLALGCFRHADLPESVPRGPLAGRAPVAFDPKRACGHWSDALGEGAAEAGVHDSFPEMFASACYVPVRYDGELASADAPPPECAYPRAPARQRLVAERDRYERIAAGAATEPLPPDLACDLPEASRRAAAKSNARTFARVLADLDAGRTYPYSAISAFGFGHRDQAESVLLDHLPGDACRPMSKADMDLLTVNVTRAGRASMAFAGRVAPAVILSGGAVHSPLVEAFALAHLAECRFGVPSDRVLVDPCADHTHTNIKHTASLVIALGGRTAYLVTDDGLQASYLEEWTFFQLLGGSIDQRALRDWGYLLGSWRRASVGMRAGFWFSPYRFWAEPPAGLGSFACTR